MKRYYNIRDSKTGKHTVQDRQLKVEMCSCNYKEQAMLIQMALNDYDERQQAKVCEPFN